MTDEPDHTMPGARFPYAAAAFCAACVAAAVWTFMLYSYAWPVTPADLEAGRDARTHPLVGRYVRMLPGVDATGRGFARDRGTTIVTKLSMRDKRYIVLADARTDDLVAEVAGRAKVIWKVYNGRQHFVLAVNASASRWTGASVAGLVVGAMGFFIFALHLRRWLRVRGLTRDSGLGGDILQGLQVR